ncbi:hypothetical protein M569_12830 [Genlisea aurea]|uniref:Uncharacterized protein n=1 Tax=Genlisea aurea TaxID=192259 RepID=S8DGP1_9LAMI|nr:hypothetical protein M569_12830 [Genlisea aurea]
MDFLLNVAEGGANMTVTVPEIVEGIQRLMERDSEMRANAKAMKDKMRFAVSNRDTLGPFIKSLTVLRTTYPNRVVEIKNRAVLNMVRRP